jgi:hypothetical protein
MYETLTGKCAFTGEAPLAVLMKHVEGRVARPAELETPLGQVILKCMDVDPQNRPPSAAAVKELLLNPPKQKPKIKRVAAINALLGAVSLAGIVCAVVWPNMHGGVVSAPPQAHEELPSPSAIDDRIQSHHLAAADAYKSGDIPRWQNELAKEAAMLVDLGENSAALDRAQRVLSVPERPSEDYLVVAARNTAYRAKCAALANTGRRKQMRELANEWIDYEMRDPVKTDDMCICYQLVGKSYGVDGNYRSAIAWFQKLQSLPAGKRVVWVNNANYDLGDAYIELANITPGTQHKDLLNSGVAYLQKVEPVSQNYQSAQNRLHELYEKREIDRLP